MPDQKISQLTGGGAAQATDEIPIARSGSNFKLTGANIAAAATSVGTLASLAVTGAVTLNGDAIVLRDAANTLAQRNGTNAQTFRLYNTFTDASNYERTAITTAAFGGVRYQQILAESAGTGAANLGIVLAPKGTGAFSLQMPDGTTAGGNARGANAVDLTMARTAAGNVASGANSFAVAGTNTRAQGANSVAFSNGAADGSQAFAAINGVASGTRAIAFGSSASASGQDAFALASSTASGQGSFAATNATASGVFAAAFGLGGSAYLRSQFAVGARGGDGTITGCQMSYVTLSTNGTVTTSSATTLTIEGASDTTLRPVVPADTTWGVIATIIGRTRNGISNVMFQRQCIIKRDGANNTTLVGSVQTLGTDIKTDTDLDMSVSITADNTNEALKVDVTGKMGGTVSSLTSSGTTCTLTSTANHGLSTGDYVTIAGANETAYNGTFVITRTGATTFTYTAATTPSATPATGTITANISCRWLCKLELTEHRFPA